MRPAFQSNLLPMGLVALFVAASSVALRAADTSHSITESEEIGQDVVEGSARPQRGNLTKRTLETGIVIIGQDVLLPPLVVERVAGDLHVNGHVVELADESLGRFGNVRRRPGGLFRLIHELERDGLFIAPDGKTLHRVSSVRLELFNLFMDDYDATRQAALEAVLRVVQGAQQEEWTLWFDEFQGTEELANVAQEVFTTLVEAHSDEPAAATKIEPAEAAIQPDLLSYPLTVLGMLLGVFSLGHLLTMRPESNGDWHGVDTSPTAQRIVMRSLGLLLLLSTLDLVWTVLAWQTGQMREMNPIGEQLMQNPATLAAFKLAATLFGAGLLYAARQYRLAQATTWWMCLVLTVVTLRWVMFNSLFLT